MDDSFKVRVDRIFGSLSSTSTPSPAAFSSTARSLWCLTDDEIERREWIKEKEEQLEPELEPTSFCDGGRKVRGRSSFGFQDDFEDDELDDLDENPGSNGSSSKFPKPDDYGDEEWEIKSSIGRDCTLDYEEDESDRLESRKNSLQKSGRQYRMRALESEEA